MENFICLLMAFKIRAYHLHHKSLSAWAELLYMIYDDVIKHFMKLFSDENAQSLWEVIEDSVEYHYSCLIRMMSSFNESDKRWTQSHFTCPYLRSGFLYFSCNCCYHEGLQVVSRQHFFPQLEMFVKQLSSIWTTQNTQIKATRSILSSCFKVTSFNLFVNPFPYLEFRSGI